MLGAQGPLGPVGERGYVGVLGHYGPVGNIGALGPDGVGGPDGKWKKDKYFCPGGQTDTMRLTDCTKTGCRLEVLFEDDWGTVCSSGFTEQSGDTVCKGLGFWEGGVMKRDMGGGNGPIWLMDVRTLPPPPPLTPLGYVVLCYPSKTRWKAPCLDFGCLPPTTRYSLPCVSTWRCCSSRRVE